MRARSFLNEVLVRNYNKWKDNNFLYYFDQKKKKKKRKFNQDKITLIISNIYSIYIPTTLE